MVYSTTQARQAETSEVSFSGFLKQIVFPTSKISFHPYESSGFPTCVLHLPLPHVCAWHCCRSRSYNFPFVGHLRILECGSSEERPMLDKRHRKGRQGAGINSSSTYQVRKWRQWHEACPEISCWHSTKIQFKTRTPQRDIFARPSIQMRLAGLLRLECDWAAFKWGIGSYLDLFGFFFFDKANMIEKDLETTRWGDNDGN